MTDVSQASLTRAHDRLDDHGRRIRSLELNEAGAAEWRSSTTEKLEEIKSLQKWFLGTVGTLVLSAIVVFVLAGGLNVTP